MSAPIARTERVAPDSEAARALGYEVCEGGSSPCVAVVLCFDASGEMLGYYEALADGSFVCVVGRDSEWVRDETAIQRWLLENL